jgi:hypothetical protein
MLVVLCVVALFPVSSYGGGGNGRNGGPNPNTPKRGGRLQLAQGIEGKKVNFGFNLGGGVTMMDALNVEAAPYGAKVSLFVHYLIPNTKTFGVGLELGGFYLLANQKKFTEILTATNRNGELNSEFATTATVGNWLLPVGQVSFMGNFHPVQRFNIQIKANLGVVIPMVPAYSGEYGNTKIVTTTDGDVNLDLKTSFSYDPKMKVGLSATVGTKMLLAINHFTEFGVGIDWSYLRFSYFKKYTEPKPDVKQVITQMGMLDLHVGFAFSF